MLETFPQAFLIQTVQYRFEFRQGTLSYYGMRRSISETHYATNRSVKSPRLHCCCDKAACSYFVAAICSTNSNQFEFVHATDCRSYCDSWNGNNPRVFTNTHTKTSNPPQPIRQFVQDHNKEEITNKKCCSYNRALVDPSAHKTANPVAYDCAARTERWTKIFEG